MRISELSRQSAIPVATIKYYLREGLLHAGEARGARLADYGEDHVARLRLIKALTDVAALPIAQIKRVLALIDRPSDDLFETLGQAMSTLPPYLPASADEQPDYPRARAALEHLGWVFNPGYVATAQFDRALEAVADAGIPLTDARLDAYAAAAHAVAEFDLSRMPDPAARASDAVQYAVLGTALYEPVVLALRRLAHRDVAARALAQQAERPQTPSEPRVDD